MPINKCMRVLKKEPGKAAEVITIDGSLPSMQGIVGGYIQVLNVPKSKAKMICNEEGRMLGLPNNINLLGRQIVGTVFFCCTDKEVVWGVVFVLPL